MGYLSNTHIKTQIPQNIFGSERKFQLLSRFDN